ncbi:unnamed protein product [Schistocephalus solidus]|uniref:RRM domain-containing protein n=1 Tax=Schistocephalus solidus TaxID=70667 RepID=A0A183TRZ2_SCHSO|nr:unnamed protein product [Schistocephalus solidus]
MADNLVSKPIMELHMLGVNQSPAPALENLTHFSDFAHKQARCKVYLKNVDAKAQSGAILALLVEEVYDPALGVPTSFPTAGESVNDFQQALRLLDRKAFPTMDATALNTGAGAIGRCSSRPQIHKSLLRDRPLALDRASPWLMRRTFFRPLAINPHDCCSASQPFSPTPTTKPSHRRLCSPAPGVPLPAKIAGIGLRSNDQTGPRPAVPFNPST